MDDLVMEFQNVVADVMAPLTRRRKKAVESQDAFRQIVVLRYYEWCQEFFCDAVGLHIGGPSFAMALTSYFRLLGANEFYVPREQQLGRRHPVGWLRIRFLIYRCRKCGLEETASELQNAWEGTAKLLSVREDYEGIWSDEFSNPLVQMLDFMIEETSPRSFSKSEISGNSSLDASPVSLLCKAWSQFENDRAGFRSWETEAIDGFLKRI
jgi:hypothetical protein